MTELSLYAVRNHKGLYFRPVGQGGGGEQWVELNRAKIYPKIAIARSRVTFFANNTKGYPAPELVRLVVTREEVVDEKARIAKVTKKFPDVLGGFRSCRLHPSLLGVVMAFVGAELLCRQNGTVECYRRKWHTVTKNSKEARAFVKKLTEKLGVPPEPFADWLSENWAELVKQVETRK